MKQLLFLLLFPCLALAQYPGNGNQKITLGEQSTADGLVYRGVENDTALITPLSDTSAYIILDTVNNRFYNYNRATNVWSLTGGDVTSFSAGTTGLTPSTATTGAVTLGGTLAVANGGTGSATQNFVDLTTAQTVAGNKGFTGKISIGTNYVDNTSALFLGGNITSGTTQNVIASDAAMNGSQTNTSIFTNAKLAASTSANTTIGIAIANAELLGTGATKATTATNYGLYIYNQTSGTNNYAIKSLGGINSFVGNVSIGVDIPTEALHVVGNARITAVGAGAYANDLNITSTGVLTTASSDEKYKYNILPINYGLNTILQLKPVNFQWIKGEENDLGFIAQDVADIIPEAVDTNWNSDLLMRYESIIPILTKAIQEQQALIKALEQRILTLENK